MGFILLAFLGLTFFWVWYFYQRDRQEKEPKKMIAFALVAGITAAIAVILSGEAMDAFFQLFGLPSSTDYETAPPPADPALAAGLGIHFLAFAAMEETAKFLALLFFYRSRFFNEASDGIFYGILIGLGFGLFEDLGYVLAFGPTVAITRAIGSLFHPAFTGLIGYFLGRKKVLKTPGITVLLAIFGISVIHGLFNWLTLWPDAEWTNALAIGIILFLYGELFILYAQSQKVYTTVYCTACGAKNRSLNRFCTRCGKAVSRISA